MEPFHLFPEEQWESVLQKLDEPDDIQNLFLAIPKLMPLFFPRFVSSCVFPILFPKYLRFKDVLNCRLHSKEWKAAVDRALVSHPDRKPYQTIVSEQPYVRVTLWSPFSYQVLKQFGNKEDLITSSDIHNKIMRLPENVNPFVGRSLILRAGTISQKEEALQVQQILKKFGRHVHFAVFKLGCRSYRNWGHFVERTLQEFLYHLPNLKSLKLDADLRNPILNTLLQQLEDNKGCRGSFNILELNSSSRDTRWWSCDNASAIRIHAQIETLDLTGLTGCQPDAFVSLFTALVSHNHLHKFAVKAEDWDDRFVPLCRNLKELNLKWQTRVVSGEQALQTAQRILRQLRHHDCLLKLSLTTCQIMKFYTLLDCLREFPLESIEVTVERASPRFIVDAGHGCDPLTFAIPSIRHIIIDDFVGFTIEHLRALPNLEYFGVRKNMTGKHSRFVHNLIEYNAPCPMVGNTLYVYFNGLDRLGSTERPIWDILRNLKMFTLLNHKGVIRCRYVRECRSKVFMR